VGWPAALPPTTNVARTTNADADAIFVIAASLRFCR
jgi:hypothetical protein